MSDSAAVESAESRGHDDPLLTVEELRTYYPSDRLFGGDPVKAVDGVSFQIGRGETFGIVGESGCGKTTLARSLLRLENVDDGEVRFDGAVVTDMGRRTLKRWRQNAQMVYQNPTSSINERMTVGEIVREPLDIHNWRTSRDRRERVMDLIDRVGLQPEHYHRYPHQFSGGQRQRVGIARALALEPAFIVLDEPVSALDVSVQAKILNLLLDLQEEFDLTYLLIAHDLSVVRHVCDRVGVMYLGKLMEVGPTGRLFDDPAHPYTKSLSSAIPHPDPDIETDRITLRGTPPSPHNPPSGCVFSTRCPFKIRPPEDSAMTDDQWNRIETFRAVIRTRAETGVSLGRRLRTMVSSEPLFPPIEEVAVELFEDVSYPEAVREHLDRAIELAAQGSVDEAHRALETRFGDVCEAEPPDEHAVGQGRTSLCHRHLPEYDELKSLSD